MSSSTERIPVGYVRRAHGVRGDVVVRPQTDDLARFAAGAVVVTDETPPRQLEIAAAREHPDGLLIHLIGVADRGAADALRGVTFTIAPSERRSLGAGEFWPDQLIGLEAVNDTGELLGHVDGVEFGAAQDRLVVETPDGDRVEVPFVPALVDEPSSGRLVIRPPDGLFQPQRD